MVRFSWFSHWIFVTHSYAGRPKSCGWNSSMLLSRSVASWVRLGSMLSSGIITTCIPAASAAFTPLGASSNTRHWGNRMISSYKPIRWTAFHPERWHQKQTEKWKPFSFPTWLTWYSSKDCLPLTGAISISDTMNTSCNFLCCVCVFSHCTEDLTHCISRRCMPYNPAWCSNNAQAWQLQTWMKN